jgi:alkylation response protein AidB-like acyl-CoA dehydrogenase
VRFRLNDDQLDLQQTLRKFLEAQLPLTAVRTAMEQGYDAELWSRLVHEVGVAAVGLPESSGGTGDSLLDQIVIATELGRALDPGPYLPSIGVVARVLHEVGLAGSAERWLASVLEGACTAAPAFLEPGSEAVPAARGTKAVLGPDGWRVSGVKRFVIHGGSVDDWLVLAGTDAGPTIFRVSSGAAGAKTTMLNPLDQTRPLVDLTLSDVPAELIGQPGGADAPIAAALRRLRVLAAAEQIGGAERILKLTTDYANTRSQFGRLIGSFQAIKHLLADAMLEIEAAKTAVLHAGWAVDHDQPDLEVVSLLCLAVSGDSYLGVAKAAIQVHGAIGFTWEHDAHLFLKRATAGRQLFGTPDQHREAIAEAILGAVA